MATPTRIAITKKPCPNYNKFPYKEFAIYPKGAFSRVPNDKIYTEDIRKYIHVPLAQIEHSNFGALRETLLQPRTGSYLPNHT